MLMLQGKTTRRVFRLSFIHGKYSMHWPVTAMLFTFDLLPVYVLNTATHVNKELHVRTMYERIRQVVQKRSYGETPMQQRGSTHGGGRRNARFEPSH